MSEKPYYAIRPGPYTARSASNKTDDWPLWYVHGADGVNCLRWTHAPMSLFIPRELAIKVAEILNKEIPVIEK
jgi:hypothetical protein